ncbi:MAG: sugar ABC transporter substrate-binding protein [Propionibacteriaceae bacterium]|jgi:multiple sugar transport system substrate-binding protein|nr:sugar ABC transporter substrate-binding protein [Propionibacteriaceae bacterium]
MQKKQAAAIIVALGLTAGGLAGCADQTAGGDSSTTGADTLTYMFRGSEDEKAAYQAAIDQFTADTGVTVDVIVTDADQYATKLQAAIAGNQVPDVFYVEQGSLQSYVNSGVLMDITDKVEELDVDLSNIWQYGVDSYRYDGTLQGTPDGRLYGLPKDVGPFAMGYNKTMLEAAGIPLPDQDKPYTWDEWTSVMKQLTKDTDSDGAIDQWGTGLNVSWNIQGLAWSNGADWTNADKTEVTVDTPEMAQALQYIADMTNIDKVTPSSSEAATLDTYQRWMAGDIGFFPIGPWDVSTYNKLDFDYDLMPFPAGSTGKPATWIGSLGIGVSQTTGNPDAAVKLAAYLSSDADCMKQLVAAGIQIPSLLDQAETYAADTAAKPANKQEFLDIVEDYGRAMPAAYTYSPAWYDEFFTNIQPVLDGTQTAADYLKEVQPRMQDLLDQANADAKEAAGGQ